MTETPLFSADLISPKVQSALPDGYIIRPLYRSDYKRGHLDVLADLAYMGEIAEEDWNKQFDNLKVSNGTYYVVVIVENKDDGKIVGTGTLVVEKKLSVEMFALVVR
jgi:glucosamine-phosphate N-acetyltransferase